MDSRSGQGEQLVFVGHSVADGAGNVLAMDEAVLAMLERSRDEVVGKSYLTFTFREDVAWNAAEVDGMSATGPSLTLTKRYLRADGCPILADVEVSLAPSRTLGVLKVGTIFRNLSKDYRLKSAALLQEARRTQSLAMLKARDMESNLLADLGWILLLELYIAESEARIPSTELATCAAHRPAESRWLAALAAAGLVTVDHGRVGRAELTALGIQRVEKVLEAGLATR